MARLGCGALRDCDGGRVLVGGLGMGYTLRATLDTVGPRAEVVVAELVPAIVAWNRGPLRDLAGRPLEDRRVRVVESDVVDVLRSDDGAFDAILLDVDNGPEALAAKENAWLYGERGLAAIRAAMRRGGVLVVWSAFESPSFEARMRRGGYDVEVVRTRARGTTKKGSRHTLYAGRVP
jgi:spermidine synthase